MKQKFKYGTIVPLIGGLTVANKKVTGSNPDFLLSYSPFAANEENVKAYFPKVPHYELDKPDNGGFSLEENKDVDFVSAVCPCAGLSLLSSGSPEQRAKMNSWMLRSAEFVTGELKPKVFWGENAPALYTRNGELVRSQFREIAEKNGYSFSIYYTNTMHHGIPQTRQRTFYFFWKDSPAPILEYYRRPTKNLTDYLAEIKPGTLDHRDDDIKSATEHLTSHPYIMFLQEKHNGKGIDKMRQYLIDKDVRGTTLLSYLIKTEQLEEVRDWCLAKGYKSHHRESARVFDKVASQGGFWDGSFPIYQGSMMFATLISRTTYAIHPTEDRCLTTRERMHLMGLPKNFKLVTGQQNHICQNVPVTTGSDMTREVVAYLKGERKISQARFIMQSNLSRQIDRQDSTLLGY